MKKLLILFTLLAIISCKKESHESISAAEQLDSIPVEPKSIPVDTIFFAKDEKSKWNDFALIYLLDKTYDKDSVYTAKFKIDFKDNSKATTSSGTFKIRGVDQGAEWSGGLVLDSIASPLKRVDFGYPACGYTQHHFLFYVENKNTNLVHEWKSGGDSGWGYWSEILSGTPEDFYFRTESFSPVDDSAQDDYGLDEYSDSIHFKLENKKWKKTALTPKGKVYRSRKVKFDDFYKQN